MGNYDYMCRSPYRLRTAEKYEPDVRGHLNISECFGIDEVHRSGPAVVPRPEPSFSCFYMEIVRCLDHLRVSIQEYSEIAVSD